MTDVKINGDDVIKKDIEYLIINVYYYLIALYIPINSDSVTFCKRNKENVEHEILLGQRAVQGEGEEASFRRKE